LQQQQQRYQRRTSGDGQRALRIDGGTQDGGVARDRDGLRFGRQAGNARQPLHAANAQALVGRARQQLALWRQGATQNVARVVVLGEGERPPA
jgi:hypothetical protein